MRTITKLIKDYENSEPNKINDFSLNFKPIFFEKLKPFSLNIKSSSKLFNYSDPHHEGRFILNMSKEQGGGLGKFSKNEELLKSNIENLIYKTFHKKKIYKIVTQQA